MSKLAGLEGVYVGRTLDIVPTITGSINSVREPDALMSNGARFNTFSKFELGLTAIYSITPNLTFSATINPDFSQVEADVPQLIVNQRFALFFPERRPFFLEGTEIFQPGVSRGFLVVDARQIVDPDCGVKLTGKLGRNSIGLITASDRAPGLTLSPDDPNFGKNAQFTILRVQRDILKDSALGFS
jgi:hypothetical protein